jgi:hypothetical protein
MAAADLSATMSGSLAAAKQIKKYIAGAFR